MNKVEIIGRLVSDPETRYSQKGDSTFAVSKYTLAVDRPHRKGEDSQADFIRCVCMGKLGEFADQYLHKGMNYHFCSLEMAEREGVPELVSEWNDIHHGHKTNADIWPYEKKEVI